MSDYLGRIIARSIGREEVIQPRLGSIFEPQKSNSWRIQEHMGPEDQVSEPRTSRKLAPPWISPNAEPLEESPKSHNPMSARERFVSSKSAIDSNDFGFYDVVTGQSSMISSLSDVRDATNEISVKEQEDAVMPGTEKKPASHSHRMRSFPEHKHDEGLDNSRSNAPSSEIYGGGIEEEITGIAKKRMPITRASSEAGAPLTVEGKRIEPSIPIAKDSNEVEVPLTAVGKQIELSTAIAEDGNEAKAPLTADGTRLRPVQFKMPATSRSVPSSDSYPESIQMTRINSSRGPNQKEPISLRGRKITAIESKSNSDGISFALRPSHASSHKPEQAIKVTIGKVEVRAVTPPTQPKRQSSEPAIMSLEEYLNRKARRFER